MASRFSEEFLRAASKPHVKWIYLCALQFDTKTLAFTSLPRAFTYDGIEYLGLGTLGKVSKLKENNKLDPVRYTVRLAGVKPALLQAILNEQYINRRAVCYLGVLDDNGQLECEPVVYFDGKMDQPTCEHGRRGFIEVNVTDEAGDWTRVRAERYTDQDQRARYPGDKGFEFVSSIASKEVIWPAASFYDK